MCIFLLLRYPPWVCGPPVGKCVSPVSNSAGGHVKEYVMTKSKNDNPTVDKVDEVIALRILVGVLEDHISSLEDKLNDITERYGADYIDWDDKSGNSDV